MSIPSRSGSPTRAAHEALAAFLDRLRPEPKQGFLSLRALVLSLGPDVVERIEGSDITYSRRERAFLHARSAKQHLTVAFPPGLVLSDPMGRLMRRGAESYVPLDSGEALDGHVQEFVRKAYAAAR